MAWKTFCDVRFSLLLNQHRKITDTGVSLERVQLVQDQEEERLEFVKGRMWDWANAQSTIAMAEDEVRFSAVPIFPTRRVLIGRRRMLSLRKERELLWNSVNRNWISGSSFNVSLRETVFQVRLRLSSAR